MLEFELIDDTENIELELENNEETIDLTLTDYDDSEIKSQINELDNKKADKTQVNELSNQVSANTTQINKNKADISTLNTKVDNIHVPTKTSELANDSGFINNTYHDNTKQDKLVSGSNIKTVNNQSLLGSGNITIESGAGSYVDLTNKPKINNVELVGNKSLNELGIQPQGNYALSSDIPTQLNQLTDDTNHRVVTDTEKETWNSKQNAINSLNLLPSDLVSDANQSKKFVTIQEKSAWNSKQNKLVSGENIKTINDESLLGSGNITIESGSSDYTELTNNPVTLRNDTGEITLYSLIPESGTVCYQFLNSVALTAPESDGTWRTTLAPGNTVSADSDGQITFKCPGGNYYMYPVETPITSETLWAGGFCPTLDDVESMVLDAGGWEVKTNSTAAGTVTMEKSQMFKKTRASGVTRLTIKFPDEIDDNYKSRLVLNTASGFSAFTISETEYDVYFYGDDCADGVLTGVGGKYYDITARADGFGGVLVEVFAKENA